MTVNCLKDHFLIAMPGLVDERFRQSVTYICEHHDNGALGITINRAIDFTLGELFEQLDYQSDADNTVPLLLGGPVQKQRGFVLHSTEKQWETTISVSDEVCITGSKDILQAMAAEEGPQEALVALGYAGWDAGQLESEVANNSWLTVPANKHIIFNVPLEKRWTAAAAELGIDMHLLSSQAGHA